MLQQSVEAPMKSLLFLPFLCFVAGSCGKTFAEDAEPKEEIEDETKYTSGAGTTVNSSTSSLAERMAAHFKYTRDFDPDDKLFLTFDMKNLAEWTDTSRPNALARLGA